MSKIKPLKEYIFIKVDKTHADTITSEGGLELMLIMGWEPGDELWHVSECGEVVAGPIALDKTFKTSMNVIPGDKIYFHFHVVHEDNKIVYDDKEYYLCSYDQAFCVIREGKIIMLSDHVLAKPVMEEQEDAFSKSGIQLRSDITPIPVKQRAVITHMPNMAKWPKQGLRKTLEEMDKKGGSKPIKELKESDIKDFIKTLANEPSFEDRTNLKATGFTIGDEIHYSKDSDIPIKIEGEIYYRMKVKDVWHI